MFNDSAEYVSGENYYILILFASAHTNNFGSICLRFAYIFIYGIAGCVRGSCFASVVAASKGSLEYHFLISTFLALLLLPSG